MGSVRAGLGAALATGGLRRLALAWLAAAVGSWAFMVSLAIYAYAEGGAAAVGLAALVRMFPAAVRRPLHGCAWRSPLAPRRPRPRLRRPRPRARGHRGDRGGAGAPRRHAGAGGGLHRDPDGAQARAGRAAPAPGSLPPAARRGECPVDRDRQRSLRRRGARWRSACRGGQHRGRIRRDRRDVRLRRSGARRHPEGPGARAPRAAGHEAAARARRRTRARWRASPRCDWSSAS
jgi:hypothetical protein